MITTRLSIEDEMVVNRLARQRDAGPALDPGAAMVALRRMGYFRDLLQAGYESTIWPDRSSRTLRSERLALGIDLPELDAVGIWATRCGDGRVSIPFIEFLLDCLRDSARLFARADAGGTVSTRLAPIDEVLMKMRPAGRPADALPRLEEVYLDESAVTRLCGSGGLVERLVEACEALGLAALPETGAPAA